MSDIHLLPVDELAQNIINGGYSLEEVVFSSREAIARSNSITNTVIWCDDDFIEQEICRVNAMRNTHSLPLFGVPILVKEIDSAIAGVPNSFGNKAILQSGYRDNFTSQSIVNLQEAGAIIIGKTNNPELALTVTTDSSAHGPCSNPLDLTRNAGGSSGGSAAAVASGMTSVAMGSDGGGSIRIPSSNCGIFGLKTSRGLISLGPIPTDPWAGLAVKGMMASRVSDIAHVLDAASSTTSCGRIYSDELDTMNVAVRLNGFADMYKINPAVVDATRKVADFLNDRGHNVVEVSPENYDDISIIEHFMNIISYCTYSDLNILRDVTDCNIDINECDPTTQFFYISGSELSSSHYDDAKQAVDEFTRVNNQFFDEYDLLITPTCGDVAPLHGAVESDLENAPFVYGGLCFPSNMSGGCALSVPVHTNDESGLPVGVQLASRSFKDALLLQIGAHLEKNYSDIFISPGQSTIVDSLS